MPRTIPAVSALLLAGLGSCFADEMIVARKHARILPARPAPVMLADEVLAEPLWLRPNCSERFFGPRVMNCAPQVYAPFTRSVLVAVEAPAKIRLLPYPTLFPYRYGN
jgi:hypothetical protein